jgi:hypothetical protein
MSNIKPLLGTFHDAATGQTITRELTADEIAICSVDYLQTTANETASTEPIEPA